MAIISAGFDMSGNNNDWTLNNINETNSTLTTYDIMNDVPTLTDEDTANFATLNPLIVPKTASPAVAVINEANLAVYNSGGSNWLAVGSTIGVSSGKWYWEVTPVGTLNGVALGIHKSDTYFGSAILGYSGDPDGYAYLKEGTKVNNSTGTAYGASYASGDIIGVALDMDAGTLTYYKNNTSQGTAFTGLSGSFMPASSVAQSCTLYHNFGQRPFAYTPPTGYKKLNTYNLPDSSIKDGSDYMNVKLWTGNGTNQDIDVGWNPDLVWYRNRTDASGGAITDSIRGDDLHLQTTNANGEGGFANMEFITNGYNVTGNGNLENISGRAFVGWHWRGSDSSAVSNTAGTIASTVSANTTAGFSVVTYTGNGASSQTIGHGLGVAPKVIIYKNRSATADWLVSTTAIDGSRDTLFLNTTAAKSDSGLPVPSSTTFSIGTGTLANDSGNNYVAYFFAEVEGYSKFGSYTGNGSTDGTFVYTGFRPAFILWKRTDVAGNSWRIKDSTRNPYNETLLNLFPNDVAAENSDTSVDFVSNGFKNRSTGVNVSSATYIYMAFAENPFKNSLAR